MTACAGVILASSASAAPPAGDTARLQQLNRANEATLRHLQRPPAYAASARTPSLQRALDRGQQVEQQSLQERQRRKLLMLNSRARMGAGPAVPYSLQGIHLQRQFELQQQRQLDRFRLQR